VSSIFLVEQRQIGKASFAVTPLQAVAAELALPILKL